jgi:hypothetical protein|eukprot:31504-Pelagococcus_subviridis.AAC.10
MNACGVSRIDAHASHSSASATPRDSGRRVRQPCFAYSDAEYVHARFAPSRTTIEGRGRPAGEVDDGPDDVVVGASSEPASWSSSSSSATGGARARVATETFRRDATRDGAIVGGGARATSVLRAARDMGLCGRRRR